MNGKTNREKGNYGENIVAEFLKRNNYQILERNYTVRGGEIDIIAFKNDTIAFVEVKTRRSGALVSGQKAVTAKKRKFIVRAAEAYYLKYKAEHGQKKCRFDVAVVELENGELKHVSYYVAAFNVSGA